MTQDTPNLDHQVSALIESCHGVISLKCIKAAQAQCAKRNWRKAVDYIYDEIISENIGISETIWKNFKDCVFSIPGYDQGRVRGLLQDNVLMHPQDKQDSAPN